MHVFPWMTAIMTTSAGGARDASAARVGTQPTQPVTIAIQYDRDGRPSAVPDSCTVDEGAMITWLTTAGVTSPFTITGEPGRTAWGEGGMQLPSHPSGDSQEVKVNAHAAPGRYKYGIKANGHVVDPEIIIKPR